MAITVNLVSNMIYLFLILLSVASVTRSERQIKNYVEKLAYDYDLYESVLDPELCQLHLQQMSAFEFYDASFRIPVGISRGNFYSLSQYHQCLGINQPLEEGSIRGKYCLFQTRSLNIPILAGDTWPANVSWVERKNIWNEQNLEAYEQRHQELAVLLLDEQYTRTAVVDLVKAVPLTLAMCFPRACSVRDVLGPLAGLLSVEFNYTELFCRLPEDKPYSGADIAAVVVFSILGLLTLLSTSYELHHIFIKKASTAADELWSCFSVYRNTDQLMTLADKPRTLDCLDGIRSLSILWVIIGHTFLVYFTEYV